MSDDDPSAISWADASAWRFTYAGPQGHWRTPSIARGLRFVAALEDDLTALDLEPDIDFRPEAVTVQLRGEGTRRALVFAVRAQRLAAELGLEADASRIQTVSLSIAHVRGVDVRPFWAAALGYEPVGDRGAADPLRRAPFLAFQHLDRAGRGRLHVDVSVPADLAEARVEAVLAAGGRLADDRAAPDWWTVASPDNHGVDIVAWPDRARTG